MLSDLLAHGHDLRSLARRGAVPTLGVLAEAVGYEQRRNELYSWDGMKRGTEPFLVIQHTILGKGQLRRHATNIRSKLAAARSRSVKLALAHGCTFSSEPAGLFGWVDTGVDTDQLAQRMLDHGYLLAPGALFHASRQPSTLMRINFATTQNAEFWKVFKKEVESVG